MLPAFLLPIFAISGWAIFNTVLRLLVALGVGFVTYKGLDILYAQLLAHVSSNISSMNSVMLQMASLVGFVDAVGILLGAVSVKIIMIPLRKMVFGPRITQGWTSPL